MHPEHCVRYRSGVCLALKTRFTRDRDILNVRAMAAGFMPP